MHPAPGVLYEGDVLVLYFFSGVKTYLAYLEVPNAEHGPVSLLEKVSLQQQAALLSAVDLPRFVP